MLDQMLDRLHKALYIKTYIPDKMKFDGYPPATNVLITICSSKKKSFVSLEVKIFANLLHNGVYNIMFKRIHLHNLVCTSCHQDRPVNLQTVLSQEYKKRHNQGRQSRFLSEDWGRVASTFRGWTWCQRWASEKC